jgi:hypothetical protein
VVGSRGGEYKAAASFFSPYDLRFAQNRFDFLTQQPALVSTYGMTRDPNIAKLLMPVRTLAEVEQLESRLGRVRQDPKQAERFDGFMRRFFTAWNQREGRREVFSWKPPLHISTAPREPAYHGQEPAAKLRVDRVTTLWDGEKLLELRTERVREIPIDPALSPGPAAPRGA